MSDAGFLYLRRADVELACRELDPVALVREALVAHASGRASLPPESYLDWPADRDLARSIAMTGLVDGRPGVKVISANPANGHRGLPRASGLTILLDPETARVRCLMDATYVSALRTAAVTVLAARTLAVPSLDVLAVLGAGDLAEAHLSLLTQCLPRLRVAVVYDLDPKRASRLAARVGALLARRRVTLRTARDAEEAVASAQLVVAVTTTTSGYLAFEWLRPGTLLVNVSLDDPLPEVIMRADLVFVDDWGIVRNDDRRLLGRMVREGRICGPDDPPGAEGCRRLDGTLGELLVGGRRGRHAFDQVIVVNPFGLAIEDVAVATAVFEAATRKGLGVHLGY